MSKDRIEELEAELIKRGLEIERLNAELEKAKGHELEFIKSRRAILLMMEDLNETTASVVQAKNEWEASFDAISIPLFIHDSKLKIVRANRAYQMASGIKFKEFIGKPYYEVFPKIGKPFKMCLKSMEHKGEEVEEFFLPDGRIFKARFYPVKDDKGRYLYSVHALEDVTDARKAEERLKEEMEITTHLLMISEAAAHTADIEKLREQIVHCSQKVMGSGACLLYLWDKESRVFRPSHASGLTADLFPIFRTEILDEDLEFVKEAIEKGSSIITNTDSRPFSWIPEIKSFAAIPFVAKKRYLGLMVFIYTSPVRFTEKDVRVMRGISNQISIALEESHLYKESIDRGMELSHKIETIQVMHEIDKGILSTLESQEIMDTAVRMMSKVISCDRATVALVNHEKKGFVYSAGFGLNVLSKGDFVSFEDTSATDVIETGRPQYEANLTESGGLPFFEREILKEGFLSHVRVPLNVKGEVIGVLSLGSRRPSAYTPADLSTLEKMAAQISVALENARLLSDLEELFLATVKSLSSAIDAKSPWTAGHSERVTRYAIHIGGEIGLSEGELKDLELAGLLHDIGKIGIYDVILDKPDRLSEEEEGIIRQHCVKGAEILSPIKQLKSIVPVVRHHHEFYDGRGYPDGLKRDEIPLSARILTVADTVDAMGSDRPYRSGMPMNIIIEELKRCSGMQFDPKVVEVFLKVVEICIIKPPKD